MNVLGALPLIKAPFAMRPHWTKAWLSEVLAQNKVRFKKQKQNKIIFYIFLHYI
jgi:hypothetical protein